MSDWEDLAKRSASAIARALREDESHRGALIDEAVRQMRAFRAFAAEESGPDGDRHSAYAGLLGSGVKALRLIERSRRIMEVTGDDAGGAHPASAGVMIGRATLEAVVQALDALGDGLRDLEAEAAVRRLSKKALLPAAARINHLYKLAVQEGTIAAAGDVE